MSASPEIPARVRQLATELAQPQPMRRGSVSERSMKCGKTRSRFLNAEQAAMAQQQVAAGRQFRQQVDTYWEACEEWADAQLELPTAASSGEAKKKGSKKKSKTISSRKSKRS